MVAFGCLECILFIMVLICALKFVNLCFLLQLLYIYAFEELFCHLSSKNIQSSGISRTSWSFNHLPYICFRSEEDRRGLLDTGSVHAAHQKTPKGENKCVCVCVCTCVGVFVHIHAHVWRLSLCVHMRVTEACKCVITKPVTSVSRAVTSRLNVAINHTVSDIVFELSKKKVKLINPIQNCAELFYYYTAAGKRISSSRQVPTLAGDW